MKFILYLYPQQDLCLTCGWIKIVVRACDLFILSSLSNLKCQMNDVPYFLKTTMRPI